MSIRRTFALTLLWLGLISLPIPYAVAQQANADQLKTWSVAEPESVGVDAEKLAKVTPVLQKLVDEQRIGGAVIGIVRRGKLIQLEAVGMQDIASSAPMKTDSIFRIYSMTKPVATVAALILADEGRLKLDDPVSKYLPKFADVRVFVSKSGEEVVTNPLTRAITVRDLMRHTSGLTYGFFGSSPVDKMYRSAEVLSDSDDTEALCAKVCGMPLLCQPGEKFNYSISVDVLGRVIEVVSEQSLDKFLSERIFQPLGMVDTGFFVPKELLSRFTTSYSPKIGGGLKVDDDPATSRFAKPPKFLSGGGGLVSTASDYLKFAQMLLDGGQYGGVRILKESTVTEMTTNQLPKKAYPVKMFGFRIPGLGFGLGVSVVVEAKLPGQIVGEYGWDGIASTHYWAIAEEDLAVVVLTQHSPFTTELKYAVKPYIDQAIGK